MIMGTIFCEWYAVFAVSGVVLKELKLKDKVVGYKFEDEDAKYAYLCDMSLMIF